MIKKINKNFILFLLSIITLSILSNCTYKKTTLYLYNSDKEPGNEILKKYKKKFEQENNRIRIVMIQKNETDFINKIQKTRFKKADILHFNSEHLTSLIKNNFIRPIGPNYDEKFIKQFHPKAIETIQIRDNLWGIPDTMRNFLFLYYNKSLISAPPANINEMINLKKRNHFNLQNINVFLCNFNDPLFIQPWFYGFSQENNQEDLPFFQYKTYTNTFKFLHQLINTFEIVPHQVNNTFISHAFINNQSAIIIDGEWALSHYEKYLHENLGIAPFPIINDTSSSPASWIATKSYFITKWSTKKTDEIKKFIQFMTGPEIQQEWTTINYFPSLTSIYLNNNSNNQNEKLKNLYQIIQTTKKQPENINLKIYYHSLYPYLEQYYHNEISAETLYYKTQKTYSAYQKNYFSMEHPENENNN